MLPVGNCITAFIKKSKTNFMKPEINETKTEAQQTEKGCLRVTLFFVIFTAVAVAAMFLIQKLVM